MSLPSRAGPGACGDPRPLPRRRRPAGIPPLARVLALLPAAALLLAAPFTRAAEAPAAQTPSTEQTATAGLDEAGSEPATAAPPAIRVGAERIEQLGAGRYLFSGDVDIRHGSLRLQADEVEYDDSTRQCRARGHAVLEEAGGRLSGDQIDVNLETRLATITGAYGEVEPDLIVEADRLEKLSEDRYRIEGATVTSCTQPLPYWSFRVGKGTLHLGHYAHLWNLSFRVDGVPIFYTPYLLWPIKEDRASGLLLPQVGYSQRRGAVINTAWFWAPVRNFDSTLYLDYLERDGVGAGLETRWLPDASGRFRFTGYAIDERIEDPLTGEPEGERYRFRLEADQRLPHGWRLLADLNQVSDFDYFLDFERDLRAATARADTSNLELTRSWSFYTLNVRAERREQLLAGDQVLVQRRQPEIEWRGRSRRLGRSPFYFSFETSAAALERQVSYGRLDVFPKVRAPFRPAPWIEVTPSVSFRETVYTHRRDPTGAEPAIDRSLRRGLLRADLDLIGPKFSRVRETPEWGFSPRLKSVLEPRLTYTYVPDEREVGSASGALVFDEVDTVADNIHRVTYSLTSRWFALRSGAAERGALALPRRVPLPGLSPEPQSAGEAASGAAPPPAGAPSGGPSAKEAPPPSPVEFATFTLSQSYGFNAPLSALGSDRSDFSPLSASLRLNPSARQSLNVTAIYNILRRTVERTTLSTDLRGGAHFLNLTWFVSNNHLADDQSQVRLYGGTALFRRKLTLAMEAKVDLARSDVQDQRYRIGYNTQCCGFLVEYLGRDFVTSQEREYRFLVNLKGVGTLFDLQQGVR